MARLILISSAVAAGATYTPAFFWSEKLDAGLGRDAHHLKEVSGATIEHTVAAISNGPVDTAVESLLQRTAEKAQPEVQLVFLLANFDTDAVRKHGGALANVQRLMHTSASSLTVPFTSRVESDHPTMFHTTTRVKDHEVEEYLAAHAELYTNKATDVIVIEESPSSHTSEAEALKAQDAFIGRCCSIVSKATGGNYAALLTGEGSHPGARRQLGASTGRPLLITRDLLTALLIGFVLIIIFLSGFCCLFSLQTPRKFDDVRKESAHGN